MLFEYGQDVSERCPFPAPPRPGVTAYERRDTERARAGVPWKELLLVLFSYFAWGLAFLGQPDWQRGG